MGLWQAAQAGKALAGEPVAAIYSSDLLRAYVTAEAVAASTGATLTADKGLRERCFGRFEGQTFNDIEASHPEDRKSTRLNSSHLVISNAVFCLKKKKQ